MELIRINGQPFELRVSKTKYANILHRRVTSFYEGIFDAYTRPSQDKVEIFDFWNEWQEYLDDSVNMTILYPMRIIGRNSSTFSLAMWLAIDNIYLVLHITKDHNYAYVVSKKAVQHLLEA